MTTYLNEYKCPRCGAEWDDEWDCWCDDECGECGERAITPLRSTPVPDAE